jgi:hypothetical protein
MLKRIGDQELVRAVERVSRGDGILRPLHDDHHL